MEIIVGKDYVPKRQHRGHRFQIVAWRVRDFDHAGSIYGGHVVYVPVRADGTEGARQTSCGDWFAEHVQPL